MVTELATAGVDWMSGNAFGFLALTIFIAQMAGRTKTRQARTGTGIQRSEPKFKIRQREE